MDFIATVIILGLQVLRSQGCLEGCRCYSTTVECGSLGLTTVPSNIPPFTQTLFLQDNDIAHVSQQDFSHLSKLQNLYIQNNSLSTIEPGALSRQHSLVELALNGNRIQQLNRSMFEGLDHLRVLYLAGNQISRLLDFTFHGLQRLQELHLQENNLRSLADQAFLGLSSLALLDLSSNSLQTLHQATIQPLSSLQEIRLTGNLWRCDCVLHWLRNWIIQEGHRLLLGKRILCAEPPRLFGQSLLDIPGNSLVCIPPAMQLDRSDVVSRLGDDLRVTCRASGYPQPVVGWRKVSDTRMVLGRLQSATRSSGPPGPGAFERPGGEGQPRSSLVPPGDGGTLTLRNVTASHAGRYECEASNPGGRATATFDLSVNLSSRGQPLLPLRPAPGLSHEPLYESVDSMDFTALGTATQTGIAAGISLLTLVALLLVVVICRKRSKQRKAEQEERAEMEGSGLYLNDYSDGPTTFAQLEEYRDAAGHEMFVIDRSKRDFCTYKDTAELGKLLQVGPLQDQATQTAEAMAEAERSHGLDGGGVFENRSVVFQQEVKYEIHC
ncbi:leucine-rich repeat-containing protein 24 [Scyliorhinus canicula]|uniref:leucine-rich repeat-containing protein 24 n=1 Tax=Scyliorhinus canicula TaxID=7830 RepID=UPI0018F628CF|nr:leucine-rich repeat-containing protein 24 [Scyliorhinus canicula]XP_038654542.1 leucine-rich repeat-containing protein 24 [Scyliorhinus canicula]